MIKKYIKSRIFILKIYTIKIYNSEIFRYNKINSIFKKKINSIKRVIKKDSLFRIKNSNPA